MLVGRLTIAATECRLSRGLGNGCARQKCRQFGAVGAHGDMAARMATVHVATATHVASANTRASSHVENPALCSSASASSPAVEVRTMVPKGFNLRA